MLKTKQNKNNITITKHPTHIINPFTNSNRSSQYNMAVTLSNNKNSIRNNSALSQTQKYLRYNFKDLNINTNSNTAVSTAQTISKSISHIETEYKRILQTKDRRIAELQEEINYYKDEIEKFSKMNHSVELDNSSTNKGMKCNLKCQLNKKSNLNLKTSFEFNNNSFLKQHERLLSERLTKFYTPKANDLLRHINSNSGNVGINKVNINSLHVRKGKGGNSKSREKKVHERRRGFSNRQQQHIGNVNIFKSNSDNANDVNNAKEGFVQVSARMKRFMSSLLAFVEKK